MAVFSSLLLLVKDCSPEVLTPAVENQRNTLLLKRWPHSEPRFVWVWGEGDSLSLLWAGRSQSVMEWDLYQKHMPIFCIFIIPGRGCSGGPVYTQVTRYSLLMRRLSHKCSGPQIWSTCNQWGVTGYDILFLLPTELGFWQKAAEHKTTIPPLF